MVPSTPLHAALRRHLLATRPRRLPSTPSRRAQSTQQPPSPHSQPPKPNSSKATPSPPPTHAKSQDPIPTPAAPIPPPATPAVTFWQRLGPVTRAGEAYAAAQRRRPYVMQTAATLVIYFLGDVCAQYIGRDTTTTTTCDTSNDTSASQQEQRGKRQQKTAETSQPPSFASQYDPVRALRSMFIGGLAAVPGWHWFLFLSSNFNYPSRALSIFVKVAINQALFTPIFNSYFFGSHSLLSGSTPQEALERIQRAVPVSMVNSLKLWPAVTAFSFAFIPIEFRSLFAGGIAIGWQTYLSFLNKAAEAAQRAEAAGEAALPAATSSSSSCGKVAAMAKAKANTTSNDEQGSRLAAAVC
ncbi:hypothetical protein Micbo1qcDRAFT_168828 [Microdochium bolleyi]|uniref:Mpv17/PMP22 family protein n=1 Tax=Microdochium bolleyi TaxID=196109 RepID=A0A136IMN8_9PEZI|nr:hypothetical protein Micbo1qcDRAFT_168828 [Microdochium bolleyi]